MDFSIGKSIRYLRQSKNMSQAGLGIALGVSRYQVSNWELERRTMTLEDAVHIANYFKISVDEFVNLGR